MTYTLKLGPCDGITQERTLKWQLIRAGIIKDSTEWGNRNIENPNSVFYFFKHHASTGYNPLYTDIAGSTHHCGICYHDIDYQFVYQSKTGKPFVSTWLREDGESVDIEFPEYMVSGSECIHLADELKSLISACRTRFGVSRLEFEDGLIDMTAIIKSAKDWTVDAMAFPLEWFYFSKDLRNYLVWWQHRNYGGLGAHVEEGFGGTVLQKCKAALDYYRKYAAENLAWIELKQYPVHLCRAYDLFLGQDKFGRNTTRDTYCQPQSGLKYVILTKSNAMTISKRLP